jgi:hypothetical protein
VFVLADAADQPVAVRGQPVDGGLEVVDLESQLRSPSSLAIAAGDPGSWSGRTKLESSSTVPPSGSRSMTDLGAGVRNADHSIQKLALHERPALDLKTQPDEERRHRVQVRDGDADMVETSRV